MGNDLISRKRATKEINGILADTFISNFQNGLASFDELSSRIQECLKSLPAAYDTDKVVERLEEMKNNAVENILLNSQSDDLESEIEREKKHYDNIIELVKAGGTDE